MKSAFQYPSTAVMQPTCRSHLPHPRVCAHIQYIRMVHSRGRAGQPCICANSRSLKQQDNPAISAFLCDPERGRDGDCHCAVSVRFSGVRPHFLICCVIMFVQIQVSKKQSVIFLDRILSWIMIDLNKIILQNNQFYVLLFHHYTYYSVL